MELAKLIEIISNLRVIEFIKKKENIRESENNNLPFEYNNFIFFLEFLYPSFHFMLFFAGLIAFFFRRLQRKILSEVEDEFPFL
jgi:hypothetical protein